MDKLIEVIKQSAAVEVRGYEYKLIIYNTELEPIAEYGFNMVGAILELYQEHNPGLEESVKKSLKKLGLEEYLKNKYNIILGD